MSSLVMESLGWALVHSLWQGALVAVGLAAALLTVGRHAANARYALACGALVLAVALPVATGVRHATRARAEQSASWRGEAAPAFQAARAQVMERVSRALRADSRPALEAARDRGFDWREATPATALAWLWERASKAAPTLLRWLVFAWVAGVGLSSGRLTAEWVRLHQLARRALPAPREWKERLDALSGRLGLKRAVRLLQSVEVDVPSTVGWLSPVVLLPVSTLSGLPARQLEMVLAHELAHIRRHDFAVNLAQVVVETLFFYHPAVRWMSNVIRVEREHCCDDVAVGASPNPVSYARALTALETLRVMPAVESHAMSALGGSLPERVRRLVSPPASRCSSRWVAGASVLTLVSGLAVAAPLASLVMAQTPPRTLAMLPVPPAPPAPAAPPAPPFPAMDVKVDFASKVKLAAAPQVKVDFEREDDVDGSTRVGAGQPLSVDQLVALKVAGVTPERVKELRGMGLEPTVSNLVGMGHAGVTPEFVKRMNEVFGRKLEAGMLVELRHLGVTPEYVAALSGAGFETKNPRDVMDARAVGVSEQYVQGLKEAGYSGLPLQQVIELRAVGVDPGFISALGKSGLTKLTADQLQELRAVGVNPDFLRELNAAGLKNLTPEELVRLRTGGVDAEFIRRMRDTK
ncbi:M56 family metallopeptidase [Myxococcus fulvus]|uniref:M56 family metallopeptidase n=1 Tax=Myxococcus fulvus TaxID=33 RepID=UPI0020BE0F8F|nr:M56 family metallopeptidase [Myxococcus fulvus]MCK8501522.1 peptidase M56 [Myxococcus fulvus]